MADLDKIERRIEELLSPCPVCATRATRCGQCGRPVGATAREHADAQARIEHALRHIGPRLTALLDSRRVDDLLTEIEAEIDPEL